jgi:hypothetical protein
MDKALIYGRFFGYRLSRLSANILREKKIYKKKNIMVKRRSKKNKSLQSLSLKQKLSYSVLALSYFFHQILYGIGMLRSQQVRVY